MDYINEDPTEEKVLEESDFQFVEKCMLQEASLDEIKIINIGLCNQSGSIIELDGEAKGYDPEGKEIKEGKSIECYDPDNFVEVKKVIMTANGVTVSAIIRSFQVQGLIPGIPRMNATFENSTISMIVYGVMTTLEDILGYNLVPRIFCRSQKYRQVLNHPLYTQRQEPNCEEAIADIIAYDGITRDQYDRSVAAYNKLVSLV